MVYLVTSIYDSVSLKYSAPKLAINRAVAAREFLYACRTVEAMPVDDLKLVSLGEFNDDTGEFVLSSEKVICHGSDSKSGLVAFGPDESEV